MVGQNISAIITAATAIVAGILGFFASVFLQRMNSKDVRNKEQNRIIREKVEEIYTLLLQIDYAVQKYMQSFCDIIGVGYEVYGEYFHTYANKGIRELGMPADRVRMLISLYASSLEEDYEKYYFIIQELQEFVHRFENADDEKKLEQHIRTSMKTLEKLLGMASDDEDIPGGTTLRVLYLSYIIRIQEYKDKIMQSLQKLIQY